MVGDGGRDLRVTAVFRRRTVTRHHWRVDNMNLLLRDTFQRDQVELLGPNARDRFFCLIMIFHENRLAEYLHWIVLNFISVGDMWMNLGSGDLA